MNNHGKLIHRALHQVDDFFLNSKVMDFVNDHGEWDMAKLRYWLPAETCDRIRAIRPLNPLSVEDAMAWKGNGDGSFTMASAYKLVANSNLHQDPFFTAIWRWKGPERLMLHLWKVAKKCSSHQ